MIGIGPLATEWGDAPWLQQQFWGNQVWQYLFFLVYAAAAFLLSRFADGLTSTHLRRLAQQTRTHWDDKLIDLFHGPLKLVVFIFFLHLGVAVMNKPDWLQVYLGRGFGLIIAVAITYLLLRVVDIGYEIIKERFLRHDARLNLQILILLRKGVKIFVVLTAVLVAADNSGIKVTGALAGLGVTGLAVALAAQETLSNLLGSIVILADRPFVLGDRVQIGADAGVVEYIGIRSTRLRTPENDLIVIPNRNITGATVRTFAPPATRIP